MLYGFFPKIFETYFWIKYIFIEIGSFDPFESEANVLILIQLDKSSSAYISYDRIQTFEDGLLMVLCLLEKFKVRI